MVWNGCGRWATKCQWPPTRIESRLSAHDVWSMRAWLIAVGARMPAWVQDGYAEYAKRLSRDLPLQLVEISTKSRDPARATLEEGTALLSAIPDGAHVVALDGRG